jgi:predicted DCC family thiol-disulfide oxidoreductase YuxK
VARWQRLVGDRVHALAAQDQDRLARFPELSRDGLDVAVHLIEPGGRVTRGAEAVFRSLIGVWRGPLWAYERVPGCAAICEAVYRFIARRRTCHSCSRNLKY